MLYLPPCAANGDSPLPLLLYLHGASGRSDDGLAGSNVRSYGIPQALEALGSGSADGGPDRGESEGTGTGAAAPFPFGVLAPVCPRSLKPKPTAAGRPQGAAVPCRHNY